MKVMACPIEVISYTDIKGEVRPLRLRLQINDEPLKVIKIDKVISKESEKFAGNPMIKFTCMCSEGDMERIFEIKYERNTCKWILYKM